MLFKRYEPLAWLVTTDIIWMYRMYMDVYGSIWMYTDVYRCVQMYMDVYRCIWMYNACSCCTTARYVAD